MEVDEDLVRLLCTLLGGADLVDGGEHAARVVDVPVRKDHDLDLLELELEAAGVVEKDGRVWARIEKDAVLDGALDACL